MKSPALCCVAVLLLVAMLHTATAKDSPSFLGPMKSHEQHPDFAEKPYLDDPDLESLLQVDAAHRAHLASQFEIETSMKGTPVHEIITTMALNEAGVHVPPCEDYMKCKTSVGGNTNFIKGVFWNDDPKGLLWKKECDADQRTGLTFASEFCGCHCRVAPARQEEWNQERRKNGWELEQFGPRDNLLCRSHFGDLAFLHAQESTIDVSPSYTRTKMFLWSEFTYRVAIGEISADAKLSNLQSPSVVCNKGIEALFKFHKSKTVADLFLVNDCSGLTSAKRGLWTRQRAWGSLMHLIQDSFAGAHAIRDNAWRVKMFTAYPVQDGNHHAMYDTMPNGETGRKVADFRTVLPLLSGAMQAYYHCVEISRLILRKASWMSEAGKFLREKVWPFSPAAQLRKSHAGVANMKSLATAATDSPGIDMCVWAISKVKTSFDMSEVCTKKVVDSKYRGSGPSQPPREMKYDRELCPVYYPPGHCKDPETQQIEKKYAFLLDYMKIVNAESWFKDDNVAIHVYLDNKWTESIYRDMSKGATWAPRRYFRYGHSIRLSIRERDGALGDDEIGSLAILPPTKAIENIDETVRWNGWFGDGAYQFFGKKCDRNNYKSCSPGKHQLYLKYMICDKSQESTDELLLTLYSDGKVISKRRFDLKKGQKKEFNFNYAYNDVFKVKITEVDTAFDDKMGTLVHKDRLGNFVYTLKNDGAEYRLYFGVTKWTP